MKTIIIPAGQSIDPYLKQNREPGTTFHLERGTYYTAGAFDFEAFDLCMLAPSCTLLGEGSTRTRIVLMNPKVTHGGKPTNYVEALTGGARSKGRSDAIFMSGFTLSMGEYTGPTVGVHVWSSGAVIRDLHVEDIVGYRTWPTHPNEGFGIILENAFESGPTFEGGGEITECKVIMKRVVGENYSTGIAVGTVRRDVPLLTTVVSLCIVVAQDAHCGFAFSDHVDIQMCETYGTKRAIFADTKPIRNSRVIGMLAQDVGWAMELRGSGAKDVRSGIILKGCCFRFRHHEGYSQVLLLSDDSQDGSVPFQNIVLDDCTFIPDLAGRGSMGRCSGPGVGEVQLIRNVWAGNWEGPVLQKNAAVWSYDP